MGSPALHSEEKNLPRWLKEHGFAENPFALREAGREKRLFEYFVEGPHYDDLKGEANDPRSVFVFAARGCGKSAYRVMIQSSCRPNDRESNILAIPYTDFGRILAETNRDISQVTVDHHVRAILCASLTTLLNEFIESPEVFLDLPLMRRKVFNALLHEHAPWLLHPVFLSDRLKKWGKDEAANLLEELEGKRWTETVLATEPLSRFLETLLTEQPETLPASLLLMDHWHALVALIRRSGIQAVYIMVDGLDEFLETALDVKVSATGFLIPLLASLSLMETEHVAFKFCLPLEVLDELRDHPAARFDRLEWYTLEWQDKHLGQMLKSRLLTLSGGRVPSLDAIADESVVGRIDAQLVEWAHGSPRKLLLLGDIILTLHCDLREEYQPLLTEEDLRGVPDQFRREYGPLVPPLSLDETEQKVLIGGRPVREALSPLEYRLLQFLYENAGEIKSKDDIYLAVYQTTEGVSNEAFDSLVFRLRQKIEANPSKPSYLLTLRSQGYKLVNVE